MRALVVPAAVLVFWTLAASLLFGQPRSQTRNSGSSIRPRQLAAMHESPGASPVIATPFGSAVQFDGVEDALFVSVHPLAGAETWTWEVIFRPDADGAPAQRFFHLSVLDPATGKDADDRLLFEIRIVNGQWCLDSFAMADGQSKTLLNCERLHALGKWYRVTAVYDGKTLSNYVGDELQGEGSVQLAPQRPGHSSVGVRINLKDHFKGGSMRQIHATSPRQRFLEDAAEPRR